MQKQVSTSGICVLGIKAVLVMVIIRIRSFIKFNIQGKHLSFTVSNTKWFLFIINFNYSISFSKFSLMTLMWFKVPFLQTGLQSLQMHIKTVWAVPHPHHTNRPCAPEVIPFIQQSPNSKMIPFKEADQFWGVCFFKTKFYSVAQANPELHENPPRDPECPITGMSYQTWRDREI